MRTLDEPTPCHKNTEPFDTLMDHAGGPAFRVARREALDLCTACPVRAECWTENADEAWVQALNPPRRICKSCGHTFDIPRQAPGKRYCSAACGVSDRTKPINKLTDIPEVVRIMHAEHVRLRSHGEEIPEQIRKGEATYQRLRHAVRKARKAAA